MLAAGLGACTPPDRPSAVRGEYRAWSGPGWYLERPRVTLAVGPEIFAGPFTYDQCEAKRVMEFDPATAERLICIHEYTKPGRFGPY